MSSFKIDKKKLGFKFLIIGLYVLPYILRQKMFGEIASVNVIFYMGVILLLTSKDINVFKNVKKEKLFYILFVLSSFFLISFIEGNNISPVGKIKTIFAQIFPAIVISIKIDNSDVGKKFCDNWFKILKIVCYAIIIEWIIDVLTNNSTQKFWVNFYKVDSLKTMVSANRFISFYGHSLVNANLMLIFLLWTLIRKNENIFEGSFILNIIAVFVGIAFTGSKSAFIISILMIITFFTNKKNYKYLILILCIIFIAYKLGTFNIIIDRIEEGLSSGDITTNRNSSIERLINKGVIEFKIFKGHEINSNNTAMIAALEYPILRWAFRNGIAFSIIMTMYYILYPIAKLLKTKKWRIILGYILYVIFVNGEDGIASYGDSLILFTTNFMLIITLCRIKNIKETYNNE